MYFAQIVNAVPFKLGQFNGLAEAQEEAEKALAGHEHATAIVTEPFPGGRKNEWQKTVNDNEWTQVSHAA